MRFLTKFTLALVLPMFAPVEPEPLATVEYIGTNGSAEEITTAQPTPVWVGAQSRPLPASLLLQAAQERVLRKSRRFGYS
jgi:hypothetical protein